MSLTFTKHGNVASCSKYGMITKAMKAGTTFSLGTLPEEFRPLETFRTVTVFAKASNDGGIPVRAYIGTDGVVDIVPLQDLVADTNYIFGWTYGVPV